MAPDAGFQQQKAARRARRERVLTMRIEGVSLPDIAKKVGVSERTAQRDVDTKLKEISEANATHELSRRALVSSRLEALIESCLPRALDGNHDAFTDVLRAFERLCKLHGFDAPSRTIVDLNATLTVEHEAQRATDALRELVNEYRIAATAGSNGAPPALPGPVAQ